jgi:hypothetical protein
MQMAEMKFFRWVAGYTRLDCKQNATIRKELKIVDLNGCIKEFCQKWMDHPLRMPKQIFK